MWAMMEKLRIWLRSVTDANYFTKLDLIPESLGGGRMGGILAYLPPLKNASESWRFLGAYQAAVKPHYLMMTDLNTGRFWR